VRISCNCNHNCTYSKVLKIYKYIVAVITAALAQLYFSSFRCLIVFLNLKTNRGKNKMKIRNIIITLVSAIALLISASTISFAKVVGDKIILGAAISLTGKYSSNGVHTQNGYNLAVDRINDMGGFILFIRTFYI